MKGNVKTVQKNVFFKTSNLKLINIFDKKLLNQTYCKCATISAIKIKLSLRSVAIKTIILNYNYSLILFQLILSFQIIKKLNFVQVSREIQL